jgi:hypothetical protein
MKGYLWFTLGTALLINVLEVLAVAQAESTAQAAPVAPCDMRLRVEVAPGVSNPSAPEFISSLLSNHPNYQLVLQRHELENSSVITVILSGPGPQAGCREVVESMRRNARVASVEVQREPTSTMLAGSTAQPTRAAQLASAVQPMGTVHAGVDGDWVVEPLNGVSYAQQARDRYECDIFAVHQTGFDPTKDDDGVAPEAVPGKRADYLGAEATCLQSRGYLMR